MPYLTTRTYELCFLDLWNVNTSMEVISVYENDFNESSQQASRIFHRKSFEFHQAVTYHVIGQGLMSSRVILCNGSRLVTASHEAVRSCCRVQCVRDCQGSTVGNSRILVR